MVEGEGGVVWEWLCGCGYVGMSLYEGNHLGVVMWECPQGVSLCFNRPTMQCPSVH